MKKKILIIYEFNDETGKGHKARAKILYNQLLNKSYDVKIINLNKFNKISNLKSYDLYILDLKNYLHKKLKKLKRNYKKILTIDNFDNNFGDLNISIFEHNNKLNKKKRVSGLKYILFNNKLKIKNLISQNLVFISLGYIINKKKIDFVKKIININKNYNFVLAPNFKSNISSKKNIKIANKKNYFKYLKKSNFCITNAGNTLIEALYFNKKCLVLPQTRKEKTFANYLASKKIIINYNKSLYFDLKNIVRFNFKNKLDKKGFDRINKLIKKLIK